MSDRASLHLLSSEVIGIFDENFLSGVLDVFFFEKNTARKKKKTVGKGVDLDLGM